MNSTKSFHLSKNTDSHQTLPCLKGSYLGLMSYTLEPAYENPLEVSETAPPPYHRITFARRGSPASQPLRSTDLWSFYRLIIFDIKYPGSQLTKSDSRLQAVSCFE